PRRVHARAERRQDAHAPVAELVAEALDDDGLVGGQLARRLLLLADVGDEVARGALVELVALGEPLHGLLVALAAELAHEGAERAAELERPARALAAPERHLARLARRRLDDDAIARDLDGAPRRRAEQESLPDAQLVHHLLVELADARPFGAEVHAVEAAVGNRARVDDGEEARVLARGQFVARAIPDDARPQIGERVRRIAPGEHVEDAVE